MSFNFKRFSLCDCRCAMKIGTDGVLLGAWTHVPAGASTAVDLGAGCGLVSLMLAQRAPWLRVTAVEIDPDAAADCRDNILASPFADRVRCICADATGVEAVADLIVSNPPFFDERTVSPDIARAVARSCNILSPDSVIDIAAQTLSAHGTVAMITPASPALVDRLTYRAEMKRLKVRRLCTVHPTPTSGAARVLWQLGRVDGSIERQSIVIRDNNGNYTSQYKQLTNQFYLHFT